jgi:predicted SprT family Zn-dependent metalloprotease
MDLARQAYVELYNREPQEQLVLKYHAGLHGYNATIRKEQARVTFRLSTAFRECEPEVQIGVMQFLLNRLNKTKITTDNIKFYHTFLRRMSDLAPVTEKDPVLQESFERVNEEYFGMMSMPNLVWGNRTMSLLGTYTYANDTIMISSVLADAPQELLDYVMHHEMLHKKHKFTSSGMRTNSHTGAFRQDEAKWSDTHAEAKLKRYLGAQRRMRRVPSSFVDRVMDWF